ncbi:MAG: GPGG-motif small membrane protein [Actinomycetota bacterium]|nr:GPGG-motif small membrane protein [Actinomycetota bacterium]
MVLALGGGAAAILWIIAVILVIWGILTLIRGGVLLGIILIIVGLLIGPGGVSIFK